MGLIGADPHFGFILAAYLVTGLTCLGLIAWIVLDHRRQTALLGDLEARGVTRRSARSGGGP
jgi:heme exporter protein D